MKFEQIQVKIWKMKHRYAGRKPQKKNAREKDGTTYKLQNLSPYG